MRLAEAIATVNLDVFVAGGGVTQCDIVQSILLSKMSVQYKVSQKLFDLLFLTFVFK